MRELTVVLRELTLDTNFMWGRSEEANSRSERVNTNVKELTLTRCGRHFKKFDAKLTVLWYLT